MEKLSKLEDIPIKVIRSEQHREDRVNQMNGNWEMCSTIKKHTHNLTSVSSESQKVKESGAEKISNIKISINTKFSERHKTLYSRGWVNPKEDK